MQARSIIGSASFGPGTPKVLYRAFDEAWASIAGNLGEEPSVIDRAKVRLAHALLSRGLLQHFGITALFARHRVARFGIINAEVRGATCNTGGRRRMLARATRA
jgi:hypothetical protein